MEQKQLQITLNGKPQALPEPMSVARLLERLNLPAERVAVERNLQLVSRDDFGSTIIQANDRIEVVSFVGGGSP